MTTATDCTRSLMYAGKMVSRYPTATMFFWMNLVNGVSDGGSGKASGSSDGVTARLSKLNECNGDVTTVDGAYSHVRGSPADHPPKR